jgi:hypothetical protein
VRQYLIARRRFFFDFLFSFTGVVRAEHVPKSLWSLHRSSVSKTAKHIAHIHPSLDASDSWFEISVASSTTISTSVPLDSDRSVMLRVMISQLLHYSPPVASRRDVFLPVF